VQSRRKRDYQGWKRQLGKVNLVKEFYNMLEFLIITAIVFAISNLYFFLFFRKKKSKLLFAVILSITILSSIFLIAKTPTALVYDTLKSFLFILLINILIPGYFLMLLGINSLLEDVLIIRGYFSYNTIFSVLIIFSTIIYYFISMFFMMILSLDYF
jgi:hypothetical protein